MALQPYTVDGEHGLQAYVDQNVDQTSVENEKENCNCIQKSLQSIQNIMHQSVHSVK